MQIANVQHHCPRNYEIMLPATASRLQHLEKTSSSSQQPQHQQQQQQSQLRESEQQSNEPTNQKRTASMIFRIEQLLPSVNEVASGSMLQTLTTKRTKVENKNVRGGVYLAQFTPKDTHSESLPSAALMTTALEDEEQLRHVSYCQLKPNNGMLSMTPTLLRKIKLSEDVYSFNAIFELHENQVRVRLVRDVARDDELVAWFGEELTLLMSIPFLTPLNIQGNNRYTCHMCQLTFETPHPLKIHLALGCGRSSMDILWIRLHYSLNATPTLISAATLPILHSNYATTTTTTIPTTTTTLQHSPVHAASSTSSISPAASPQPAAAAPLQTQTQTNAQRFSAFKPIIAAAPTIATSIASTGASSSSSTSSTPILLPLSTLSAPRLNLPPSVIATNATTSTGLALSYLPAMSSAAAATLPHMNLLQPISSSSNSLNAAAQIEAIVSNMGASKQGHLCIYCGKVYSRKYGLKIHIRTHTGFKPLKCKFCLRPFGDPSNLNKHVRLHLQATTPTGTRTGSPDANAAVNEGYQCHVCNKVLVRRRDLQRHMEMRHNGQNGRHGQHDADHHQHHHEEQTTSSTQTTKRA